MNNEIPCKQCITLAICINKIKREHKTFIRIFQHTPALTSLQWAIQEITRGCPIINDEEYYVPLNKFFTEYTKKSNNNKHIPYKKR